MAKDKKKDTTARDKASEKNSSDKKATARRLQVVEARTRPEGAKMAKVKSLVNLSLPDGCDLVVGKTCEITLKEKERLEKDARGPFFE